MPWNEDTMQSHQCSLSIAPLTVHGRRIKDTPMTQRRNTGTHPNCRTETHLRPSVANETIHNRPAPNRTTEKNRKIKKGHHPNQESQIRTNRYIYSNTNNITKDLWIGIVDITTQWHPYPIPAITKNDNTEYNRILGIICQYKSYIEISYITGIMQNSCCRTAAGLI